LVIIVAKQSTGRNGFQPFIDDMQNTMKKATGMSFLKRGTRSIKGDNAVIYSYHSNLVDGNIAYIDDTYLSNFYYIIEVRDLSKNTELADKIINSFKFVKGDD
jgi:ligand-binding sensor protein